MTFKAWSLSSKQEEKNRLTVWGYITGFYKLYLWSIKIISNFCYPFSLGKSGVERSLRILRIARQKPRPRVELAAGPIIRTHVLHLLNMAEFNLHLTPRRNLMIKMNYVDMKASVASYVMLMEKNFIFIKSHLRSRMRESLKIFYS